MKSTHRYHQLKKVIFEKLRTELPSVYKYHSFEHTENMLAILPQYVEPYDLNEEQIELLQVAILFHDLGFTVDWKNHESKSVKFAEMLLPEFNYSSKEIELVQNLIMATKIPQTPENILQSIICDVDLDYLGRDDYFSRRELLYQEWLALGIVEDREEWADKELKFLANHQFHSIFGKEQRQPILDEHVSKIQKGNRLM